MTEGSKCDKCGDTIFDLDAGFSPSRLGMTHDCGGKWIAAELEIEDISLGDHIRCHNCGTSVEPVADARGCGSHCPVCAVTV